ncbi:MAG TPA: ATP-dependent Clp protease proteolytic subunit, partial [Thiotrichaceae bacterium]|nr:ATP-dependent Clp protease proteolytic subunit [Thiotrichaceae bacterium]
MQRLKDTLNQIMGENCGKTAKKPEKDTERDNFMSSAE